MYTYIEHGHMSEMKSLPYEAVKNSPQKNSIIRKYRI